MALIVVLPMSAGTPRGAWYFRYWPVNSYENGRPLAVGLIFHFQNHGDGPITIAATCGEHRASVVTDIVDDQAIATLPAAMMDDLFQRKCQLRDLRIGSFVVPFPGPGKLY